MPWSSRYQMMACSPLIKASTPLVAYPRMTSGLSSLRHDKDEQAFRWISFNDTLP